MPIVQCPACGESEALAGERDGQALRVTCEACGTAWLRDPDRSCGLCRSKDLRHRAVPLWEKARGRQRTPAGWLDAYDCYVCGGRDVTSAEPTPGDPAELTGGMELRESWQRHREA